MKMSIEERLLICLAKVYSSEEEKDTARRLLQENIDWVFFIRLTSRCGITPLIVKNILALGSDFVLPEYLLSVAETRSQEYTLDNMLLWNELLKIKKAAESDGIAIIPMKGIILTQLLYDNPSLRMTSDIDILARKESLPKLESALNNLGYRMDPLERAYREYHRKKYFHFTFEKNGLGGRKIILDLHWDIVWPSSGFSDFVTDFWERAAYQDIIGERILALSPEDALIESLIEIYKDFFHHKSFLLKRHIDVSQILRVYAGEMDWDYLVNKISKHGLKGLFYYALSLGGGESVVRLLPGDLAKKIKPGLLQRTLISKLSPKLYSNRPYVPPQVILFDNFFSEVILRGNILRYIKVSFFKLVILPNYAEFAAASSSWHCQFLFFIRQFKRGLLYLFCRKAE